MTKDKIPHVYNSMTKELLKVINLPLTPQEVREYLENTGIRDKLNAERFPFHNWEDHVLAVYDDAGELAEKAGLAERERYLLQIASLYHDIAYPIDPKKHERLSAEMAREDLLKLRFLDDDIVYVEGPILATKGGPEGNRPFVTHPYTLPGRILCDADLAALGKPIFEERGLALMKELRITDLEAWNIKQLNFLEKHEFHTNEGEELWGMGKKDNIQKFKRILGKL